MILGIRPEDLEDARSPRTGPPTAACAGAVELREALGAEIMVHFTVDARPALTEDVRELAQDVGDERSVQLGKAAQETTMVGRFGSRSTVQEGAEAEVAVDTRELHFFDPETGLGIYDNDDLDEGSQ